MTATDCPFCSPKIDVRKQPIHFETKHWRVTDNETPYENSVVHLLILPKNHITEVRSNTPGLWAEFYNVVIPFLLMKKWPEGTLLMRLGKFEVTGNTVKHLHLHWIVPKPGQTVYAHMGPRKWKIEEWQES